MKIKILIAVVLCTSTIAKAQLIDLTPGGFNPEEGLPPVFFELQNQMFFDEAAHGTFNLPDGDLYINGWVSMFGELDGGTYFQTNLFQLGDTPSASVWWNFGRSNYRLTLIDVFGRRADGSPREHIYAVRNNRIGVAAASLVTVDGMARILSISFYGTDQQGRKRPMPFLVREYLH